MTPAAYRYCPVCAAPLEWRPVESGERLACSAAACGFVHWDNPIPVVAGFVETEDGVVLARNAAWPEGAFSMITGFLERDETPEAAIAREAKEELGVEAVDVRFIGVYPLFRRNQLIVAYAVLAMGKARASAEIAEVRLVAREDLPNYDFGQFVLPARIVSDWLKAERDDRPG